MSNHKDKIKGGLADKKSSKDFDPKRLEEGIKVEMEHTSDKQVAKEIAMDHLTEDKNYYSKLKEIEKQEKKRVDIEADGKRELDYGKEELNKDPKKKKKKDYHPVNIDEEGSARNPEQPEPGDLSKKWEGIKKALDNENVFLDMSDASGIKEEEEQEAQQEAQQQEQQEMEAAQGEQEPQEQEEPEESEEQEVAPDEEEQPQQEMSEDEIHEMLAQELAEAGMSEQEIAHILHGHGIPIPDPVDQSKVALNQQKAEHSQNMHEHELDHKKKHSDLELEHKKRLQDAEYENKKKSYDLTDLENNHKRRMLDLEYEQAKEDHDINDMDRVHKQRMLDLEYEYEKKQKDLELEMKRKELDMKMKHKSQLAGEKHKQKLSETKNHASDASQTSKKEMKGDIKKSIEDETEELEKNAKLWSHNPKTGQINHPEHGSIHFGEHENGIEIKHNGKSLGVHSDKESALSAAKDYMINLSKPVKVGSSVNAT